MRFIEVRLRDAQQLFNSMDPSPFHEKDLDRDAEEFIVSWAKEIPLGEPVALRVHLETGTLDGTPSVIGDAVRNYFTARAEHGRREFRQLMRLGRRSLTIGIVFLGVCIAGAEFIAREGLALSSYVRESLTIAGWVAMWRPMEIYLYDWWPIRRANRNLERLATMDVEVLRSEPRS